MQVVGLTGGIATGKSLVGAHIRALGAPVIDADVVSREVVTPGSPTLEAILESFAPDVVTHVNGELDRAAMRRRIAEDVSARRRLEAITHPAIRQAIEQALGAYAAEGHVVAVVEAALMVETGSYKNYPNLIVVSCSAELQLERLMSREGMSEEAAREWIETQLPLVDKERVATHLIHNNGDKRDLQEATEATWTRIMGAL
jgi:dephospho-CoA kinase